MVMEELVHRCIAIAEWRESLAEEFPYDLRNALAAVRLRTLAKEICTHDTTNLRINLQKFLDIVPECFKTGKQNILDEHLRLVGFYVHPKDARDLLKWIYSNVAGFPFGESTRDACLGEVPYKYIEAYFAHQGQELVAKEKEKDPNSLTLSNA